VGLAADVAGPVGFIGLGVMGSALSSHLIEAGYQVIGYDPVPAAVSAHAARGGLVAGGPAAVAAIARTSVISAASRATMARPAYCGPGYSAPGCRAGGRGATAASSGQS